MPVIAHNSIRYSVRYQPDDHFVFSVNHLGRKRIPQNALSSIQQPILVMTGTADVGLLFETALPRLTFLVDLH